jgi:hypothetical protein
MATQKSIDKKYNFKTGFNVGYVELDNIITGKTQPYLKVSKLRGTYPNYERNSFKGIIMDNFKTFKAISINAKGEYVYKECKNPYQK